VGDYEDDDDTFNKRQDMAYTPSYDRQMHYNLEGSENQIRMRNNPYKVSMDRNPDSYRIGPARTRLQLTPDTNPNPDSYQMKPPKIQKKIRKKFHNEVPSGRNEPESSLDMNEMNHKQPRSMFQSKKRPFYRGKSYNRPPPMSYQQQYDNQQQQYDNPQFGNNQQQHQQYGKDHGQEQPEYENDQEQEQEQPEYEDDHQEEQPQYGNKHQQQRPFGKNQQHQQQFGKNQQHQQLDNHEQQSPIQFPTGFLIDSNDDHPNSNRVLLPRRQQQLKLLRQQQQKEKEKEKEQFQKQNPFQNKNPTGTATTLSSPNH